MIILYTTQCCSTTREVITTALYCKHQSYYPGERPHLSFSCTYHNMMLLQVEDCRSFIQKACRDLEGNGEVVFGLPFPVIPHQPISLNMSMWVTISLNMSMWVTISLNMSMWVTISQYEHVSNYNSYLWVWFIIQFIIDDFWHIVILRICSFFSAET